MSDIRHGRFLEIDLLMVQLDVFLPAAFKECLQFSVMVSYCLFHSCSIANG